MLGNAGPHTDRGRADVQHPPRPGAHDVYGTPGRDRDARAKGVRSGWPVRVEPVAGVGGERRQLLGGHDAASVPSSSASSHSSTASSRLSEDSVSHSPSPWAVVPAEPPLPRPPMQPQNTGAYQAPS